MSAVLLLKGVSVHMCELIQSVDRLRYGTPVTLTMTQCDFTEIDFSMLHLLYTSWILSKQ